MEKLIVMNTREIKEVANKIQEQWGCSLDLDGAFFRSPRDKIYYVAKDIGKIDWNQLKINSIGMYFAHVKNGVRLSIEGSQLLGPKATKGVVELTTKESKEWMQGIDLVKDVAVTGFVLITYGNDFLGCGKVVDGKILNYVPKIRRLLVT